MRRITVTFAVIAVALALAGPVAAAKPVGGCPNPKFELMTYTQFRNLSLSVGVPAELLGPEHAAAWDKFDKNDDGRLCVMDLPDTPGTFFGWIFNVIDNTAKSR